MEVLLSQKLSQYFERVVGDETSTKNITTDTHNGSNDVSAEKDTVEPQSRKRKKKKRKELKIANEKENPSHPMDETHSEKSTNDISEENSGMKQITEVLKDRKENKGFTEDGFKIVSSIPVDDSDISDAFESCDEEEEERGIKDSKNTRRQTEDGFKIVTEIPPDDSDVSDAFDEEEESVPSLSLSQTHIKKPILQIMEDFGIDSRSVAASREQPKQTALKVKLSKKQQKRLRKREAESNTLTQAAKRVKQQRDIEVINYSERRGVKKTKIKEKVEEEQEEENLTSVEDEAGTLDEKQLKRARYDVFRLGMSGFEKQQKENAREALAIKLGAKPPKKKAINYKRLQEMRKEEKKKEAEENEVKRKLGLKVSKPFKKKDRPVGVIGAAQAGRYKHGVQVLSKRDVAKIKKS